MKKIILTFGVLAGLIVGSVFFITHGGEIDFDKGMIYGYLSMIIALSTIFFATKQYRDKYNGGKINFKKSFQVGIGITLVATIVYIIFWELYFRNLAYDFPEKYLVHMTESLQAEGKSVTEIATILEPTKEMMKTYSSNTLYRIGLTALEILPVGIIITLISSLIFGVISKDKSTA